MNDLRSRRAAFATLGMIALTTQARSVTAGSREKRKKSNDKKAKKRCRSQVAQCEALANTVTPDCEDDPVCEALLACCEFAGRCDFSGFMECATTLES